MGWFVIFCVNILYTGQCSPQDTSLEVSLPCSLVPLLPLHSSLNSSSARFLPPAVHASSRPFLARSLHQPSLPQPSLPPLKLSACLASLLPTSRPLLSPSLSPSLVPSLPHHPLAPSLPPPPSLPPSLHPSLPHSLPTIKCNWVTGSPPNFDTLFPSWYPTYMQSFIISHSSCAEQYGDMSSDKQTHT